jgi:hypothetical protein
LIPELRRRFNRAFRGEDYAALIGTVDQRCGTHVEFRVAETPIFLPLRDLEEMARAGADMARQLLADSAYLAAASAAIPSGYRVAGPLGHPNFLTADFALVEDPMGSGGQLTPRLVEIQAFPSVYGYQDVLNTAYREVYHLSSSLGSYLSGLDEAGYWRLLGKTILGEHAPENVVLTELDPQNQKTLPDFLVTARRLGIRVVDIRSVEAIGDSLFYRDDNDGRDANDGREGNGRLVPIRRIYNRAIADELMARNIQLPFDFTHPWNVEWAGHPNWYFLISKFSIPLLARPPAAHPFVPPAVFLSDFLAGPGRAQLEAAGVPLPPPGPDAVYSELLLKPLFSFAGKGIQFDPTQAQLDEIPADRRAGYLLQQRMRFVPTIETPHGLTQAEIRILYLWPDQGELTPALSLVRLGRGKMMGVDHNKDKEWVGASAAFFPPQ